jgi:ferric-chelate reductase
MGLDRVLRVLRIIVYNFGYILGKRPTELDARVDILSPDFMRISINRPQHVSWSPGQSAYISMPGIAPFQFHPFTISSIDVRGMQLGRYATESQAKLAYGGEKDVQKLAFLVKVRKGFTASLHRNAHENKALKVFFDGPYGSPPVLKGYGTVILIAGMSFSPTSSHAITLMSFVSRRIWSVVCSSPSTRPDSVSILSYFLKIF